MVIVDYETPLFVSLMIVDMVIMVCGNYGMVIVNYETLSFVSLMIVDMVGKPL